MTASEHGSSPIGCADVVEEERIDQLRLTAFRTNSHEDRQAYFEAASKWFQDRHYRRMNHERVVAALTELVSAFNPEPAFDYFPLGIWDRAAKVLAALQRGALAEPSSNGEGVTP